jgi:DnaA-homolog protein
MKQLPLVMRVAPEFDLAAFCFADTRDKLLLLDILAARKHQGLLLIGASGSGKSYLLKSLQSYGAHYFSAPYGTRPADTNAFLFDDLDQAQGQPTSEEWLFHDFNRAVDLKVPWIAAMADVPASTPIQLPDLRSRLSQCLQFRLPLLRESEQRFEVLKAQAASLGAQIDRELLDYLEAHVTRDLAQLSRWIVRLNQFALSEKRHRITPASVRALLKLDASE